MGTHTRTLTEVHRNIADAVNAARYTDEPVIVTDHGKEAVAFISPRLLEHYQRLEAEHDLAEIQRLRDRGSQWFDLTEAERAMDEIDAEAERNGR